MEHLAEYDRKRYCVLFKVWAPGASEFTIAIQACRECGFVLYSPRPTEADLENKYRFLSEQEGKGRSLSHLSESDLRRAGRLLWELQDLLPDDRTARILDFGGGDGRLMASFVEKGHHCSVVDWCDNPIAGVESLGRTVHDVHKLLRFDAIVASHVIEHVAEPRAVLSRLHEMLEPVGVIYVEVPLEIWSCPPPRTEPVTHVNFFVPGSLRRLLENAGFMVAHCRLGSMRFGNRWERVIRATARPGFGVKNRTAVDAMDEIHSFLNPSLVMRLSQRFSAPGSWKGAVGYRLRRLFG